MDVELREESLYIISRHSYPGTLCSSLEDFVPTLVRLQVLQIVSMRARSLEHLGRVCPDSVKCRDRNAPKAPGLFLGKKSLVPKFQMQCTFGVNLSGESCISGDLLCSSCLSLLFSRVVGLQCSSKYGLYTPRTTSCGSSKDYSENVW